MLVLGLYL